MTKTAQCLASMARLTLNSATRTTATSLPRFLAPAATQKRANSDGHRQFLDNKVKRSTAAKKQKKKQSKEYRSFDPKKFPQFSLCDAMRYLRAFEVGRAHTVKYELHIRLKTLRSGAVIKGNLRFPNPIKSSETRFAVICPDDSEIMQAALQAGAVQAGQTALFEQIKQEKLDFDRIICHTSSEAALNKASLGRILGPKGLMTSRRKGTITDKVVSAIRENKGTEEYRERQGVVRLPVGQLGFTPNQLAANVKTFVGKVKVDADRIVGTKKEVREVVLSTSHGPGFNLNGLFDSTDEKVTPAHLAQVM